MLYASTKATFKKQFGAGQIKDEYYANSREEISLDSKHNTLSTLSFPFMAEATSALEKFSNKLCDYVQLGIDLESECVTLIDSKSITTSELADAVPEDRARYHVFRFKHSHESDYLESNVFIYSMPGYSVPIKERMMYSSCRNAVVQVIETSLNIG